VVPIHLLNHTLFPQVFLYIREKRVVGCIVAEVIQSAYRMLESDTGLDICSQESYPAKCGISRIWVHRHYRRNHIATKMLDTVR
jgi:N-acetyltransferase